MKIIIPEKVIKSCIVDENGQRCAIGVLVGALWPEYNSKYIAPILDSLRDWLTLQGLKDPDQWLSETAYRNNTTDDDAARRVFCSESLRAIPGVEVVL